MIKQVWVAQCDLCGKMENARVVPGRYNEQQATLPIGWSNGYNKDKIFIVAKSAPRIAKEVGEP